MADIAYAGVVNYSASAPADVFALGNNTVTFYPASDLLSDAS